MPPRSSGRVIRLDPHAHDPALAQGVAAPGHVADLAARPGPDPCCSSASRRPPRSPALDLVRSRETRPRRSRLGARVRETLPRSGPRAGRTPRWSMRESRIRRLTSSRSGSIKGCATISASVRSASTRLAATRSRSDPAAIPARISPDFGSFALAKAVRRSKVNRSWRTVAVRFTKLLPVSSAHARVSSISSRRPGGKNRRPARATGLEVLRD